MTPLDLGALLSRAQRALWLVCGMALLVGAGLLVGHWRGKVAGQLEARHQVVQDSLKHNADELRRAAAHHDSATKAAAREVARADSTRATYQKARSRVVVVDDSTFIDQTIGAKLTAPAVVELARRADSLKIQDSLTIVAVTGRAAAAEAKVALLTTRVGLLEQDLAITREEHAPVIGRKTGVVLVTVVVLDAAARLLRH